MISSYFGAFSECMNIKVCLPAVSEFEVEGADEVCGWGAGMGWITSPGGGRWRMSDTSGCWGRGTTGPSTRVVPLVPGCTKTTSFEAADSNFSSSEDSDGEFDEFSPSFWPLSCCLNFACCSANWWRRTKILGMVLALKSARRKSTHFFLFSFDLSFPNSLNKIRLSHDRGLASCTFKAL